MERYDLVLVVALNRVGLLILGLRQGEGMAFRRGPTYDRDWPGICKGNDTDLTPLRFVFLIYVHKSSTELSSLWLFSRTQPASATGLQNGEDHMWPSGTLKLCSSHTFPSPVISFPFSFRNCSQVIFVCLILDLLCNRPALVCRTKSAVYRLQGN